MRWLLLALSAILLAAGVGLGVVYPGMTERAPGREIARWQAFAQDGDFAPGEATLRPADGAAVVTMVTRSSAPLRAGGERAFVLFAIEGADGSGLSRTVVPPPRGGGLESPQTGVMLYRDRVATLEPGNGLHRFLPERGEDFDEDIVLTVDFAVNAASRQVPTYARPAGYGLVGLGAIVLLLALRRRRENPNSSPSRQWGRQ